LVRVLPDGKARRAALRRFERSDAWRTPPVLANDDETTG
jgi:hypothetical protein